MANRGSFGTVGERPRTAKMEDGGNSDRDAKRNSRTPDALDPNYASYGLSG